MGRIKILRVIESMDPSYGGPCQGIRNSIPEMNNLGAINEVVSSDAKNTDWSVKDSFPIYKLGPGKGPWGYAKHLLPWLKNNLSGYDAVVVHGTWQYYGFAVRQAIGWLRAKGKRAPKFYIMPHGMLDPYFQEAPDRKLKSLRNLIFWNLVERKTINAADGILFTCQEELLLARKAFSGYAPKKEINVGYGILPPPHVTAADIDFFRKQNGLSAGEGYFLFLSRIHPKKGLRNLVMAYAKFIEKNGPLPKLVIAGPGMEDEFGKSILNIVKNDSNLENNVLFVGMVTGINKWASFNGANAFLLPSHQENFGIAVVEALACKCPVLISDKVNIWREIVDGEGGMVANDTCEGTYNLFKRFLESTNEKTEVMKKSSYLVYQNHFTVKQAAKNFLIALKNSRS